MDGFNAFDELIAYLEDVVASAEVIVPIALAKTGWRIDQATSPGAMSTPTIRFVTHRDMRC